MIDEKFFDDYPEVLSFEHEKLKRKRRSCNHDRYVIDAANGSVECAECGAFVSAFYVLKKLASEDSTWKRRLAALRAEFKELKSYKPWLKAVRSLERTWRGRVMLPQCPYCKRGVTAEELVSTGIINKEHEAGL